MKNLLAFVIGLMILFPITVVMGVAIAEEDEQVLFETDVILIDGSPGVGSAASEDTGYTTFTFVPGIISCGPSEETTMEVIDINTGEKITVPAPRVDPNALSWTLEPTQVMIPPETAQTYNMADSNSFAIPNIGTIGFDIDMDNIFSNIDISTWQTNKLPEPVWKPIWISPDESPPIPIYYPVPKIDADDICGPIIEPITEV